METTGNGHDDPPVVATPVPPPQAAPGTLTDDQAQAIVGQLVTINASLAPVIEVLDPSDKKRLAKSRPGVEQQIPLLVSLAKNYGVSLGGYSLPEFEQDVALAARLTTLVAPTVVVSQALSDTIYAIKARYYSALTTIYSALTVLAARDATLGLELEPLRKLFAVPTTPQAAAKRAEAKSKAKAKQLAPTGQGAANPSPSSGTTVAAVNPESAQAIIQPVIARFVPERRKHVRLEVRRD